MDMDKRMGKWIVVGLTTLFPTLFLIMTYGFLRGEGIIEILVKPSACLFFISFLIVLFYILTREEKEKKLGVSLFVLIIEMIALIFMTRPWYHGLAMWIYKNPAFFEFIVILMILLIIGTIAAFKTNHPVIFVIVGIIIINIGIIFTIQSSLYPKCHIAATLDIEYIDYLPSMNSSFVRITPLKVATRYALDACKYPQHTPAEPPDVIIYNSTPYWSFLLVPDGLINVYKIKPKGGIFVDMTTSAKVTEVIEQEFKFAPGLKIEDDVFWQIYKKKYFIETEKAKVIPYEGKLYLAIPYIIYEKHFHFPIWYKVPKWGGVFLVNQDGKIDDLSPEEALNHPVLEGQAIFPEKLARYYIDALRYWKAKISYWQGIWNVFIYHENEIEITDVSEQGNKQPFLLKTEEGLKWVISVEPYGRAYGMYRVYFIDARTGHIQCKNYTGKDEIGPVRACDYVRKAHPEVDWTKFQPIEPLPVTLKGNNIFWEVRVVPTDGTGIAYTAFVDAIKCKVIELTTDDDIKKFILKGEFEEASVQEVQEIRGTVIDIDQFVQAGNTRFIVTVKWDNNITDVVARAEDLNFSVINIISDLKVGEKVIVWTKNNILQDIKVLREI